MRILVGNNHLIQTGGTENYTYALATTLKKMGHEVEYFTFNRGFVSNQLEKHGIPFMSHEHYDLILANHTTVIEKLFCHGFTIQTCHGILPPMEQPSPYADWYVCISEKIRQHLQQLGAESTVILNGIDCNRFTPKIPIHQELTTVLSLCQSETANNFLQECCHLASNGKIRFLTCNKNTDNLWNIEDKINQADLVVGIGRSLYDAMACGRCVISYDYRPIHKTAVGDGYLNKTNISQSIEDNCIGRGRNKPFTKEEFVSELQKYNSEDGKWTRSFALENLNMEKAAQRYIDIYEQQKNRTAASERKETERARKLFLKEITNLREKLAKMEGKRNKYLKILRIQAYSLLCFLLLLIAFLILFT